MPERLEIIVEGLHEAFARVPGLPILEDGEVINFYDYEPMALDQVPALITLHQHTRPDYEGGQLVAIVHTHVHRVVIQRQDVEIAEREARPFVDRMIKALEEDPLLHGRISSAGGSSGGGAKITGAGSFYVVIGDTLYRAIDCTSQVTDKRPRYPRLPGI